MASALAATRRVRPRTVSSGSCAIFSFSRATISSPDAVELSNPAQALLNRILYNRQRFGSVFFNSNDRGISLADRIEKVAVGLSAHSDNMFTGSIVVSFSNTDPYMMVTDADVIKGFVTDIEEPIDIYLEWIEIAGDDDVVERIKIIDCDWQVGADADLSSSRKRIKRHSTWYAEGSYEEAEAMRDTMREVMRRVLYLRGIEDVGAEA
jgi:hypothetical protein